MKSLQSKAYLSVDEAASFLSISTSEIYKRTASQTIPHYKLSRKLLRFKISELEDYMNGFKKGNIND